jgi:sulfoxide reductase heme-binding subunit YedZ
MKKKLGISMPVWTSRGTSEGEKISPARIFSRWGLKPHAFTLCLVPLGLLIHDAFTGGNGANPVQYLVRATGDWALRFMLIALAVTPLRQVTGWNALARLRRMLGLFAFAYTALHTLAYFGIDQHFDFAVLWDDVVKRLYITVGTASLVMLIPLAVTSTDKMARRLGGVHWRKLHRFAYPAAAAGVLHYYLYAKTGAAQPLIYGSILAALLTVRLITRARKATPISQPGPAPVS